MGADQDSFDDRSCWKTLVLEVKASRQWRRPISIWARTARSRPYLPRLPAYWLSRTTVALAAGFIAVFVAVTFYVSELQEGLNRTAAIERAANMSDAVAAFRASGVQSIQHGHLAIHEHEVELFLG